MNPLNPIINHVMIPFLDFSYTTIIPNYGVGIILLTCLLKLVFYPLTKKQFDSMAQMKVIQPEITKIRETHKGNPQMAQMEMMKLYKERNINPLGGCLPLLIQLPFFIAIYMTFRSETFLAMLADPSTNPGLFPFWLSNLAAVDKTYILAAIVTITMFLSQKMTITDPNQQKIMMLMPVFMLFFIVNLPSGVLLYWAVNQVFSTAQQYYILKQQPTQ